jgi:hypothetical protein
LTPPDIQRREKQGFACCFRVEGVPTVKRMDSLAMISRYAAKKVVTAYTPGSGDQVAIAPISLRKLPHY